MPIDAIVPAGVRLQKEKTGQDYRPFPFDEDCARKAGAAGADAAGTAGAEYDGRDSIACGSGVEGTVEGEYECVGCGAGAGTGAVQRPSAGA